MARLRPYLVPLLLLVLAGVLAINPWPYVSPVTGSETIPDWTYDTSPVRKPALKPEIELVGHTYRCSECHRLFPSPPEVDRRLTQHREIELGMEHGISNRCFNCHHRDDRDAFVDYRGNTIPYDQPQLLCAKCHGPVYRDWLHGAHGRTNGYWNAEMGWQERRKCIECHDPHAPAFQPIHPAPAPETLRMGPQGEVKPHEGETANPLLIYRQDGDYDANEYSGPYEADK